MGTEKWVCRLVSQAYDASITRMKEVKSLDKYLRRVLAASLGGAIVPPVHTILLILARLKRAEMDTPLKTGIARPGS